MQKTVPIKKSSGFTLIELLLVLALVVALTVAGIAAYQIQLRNFKVDKTALQMQQWLQAGMAFKVDCAQWPTDSGTDTAILSAMTGQIPLSILQCLKYSGKTRTYMPANSINNGPWSNNYKIGPYPPGTSSDTASLFYVSTDIGASDGINGAITNAGKMIAGRLPNGNSDYSTGRVIVTAYANAVPSGGGNTPSVSGVHIVDMEMVNSGQTAQHIKKPDQKTCDVFGAGLVPALVGSMAGIDAGQVGKNRDRTMFAVMGSSFDQTTIDANGFIKDIPMDNNTKIIRPSLKTERDKTISGQNIFMNDGRNQLLLISACAPLCTVDPKNEKCKKTLSSQSSTPSNIRY